MHICISALRIDIVVARIQIAKADIVKAFSKGGRILRPHDVAEIFDREREFWRLTKSTTLTSFIRFMTEKTDLKPFDFPFPKRKLVGYTWGDVPLLETLLGLEEGAYYSHYTAMRIHGLTEQIPKTIYCTKEKSGNSALGRVRAEPYDQAAIDAAFSGKPRASSNEIELPGEQVRIVMLEGAYQGGLGVTEGEVNWGGERNLKLRYTNLERTLIDIVVRPFYAGGVFEVAKAFENAKRVVSVNAMVAMLKRMFLAYPYHQALGYYLEKCGYKSTQVELLRTLPMHRDFYLGHGLGKTSYSSRWRLYVPEGF
jgi:hypothetical protein